MKDTEKKCTCDETCDCGCQEGEPCTCNDDVCDCGCQEGEECTCSDEKCDCGCHSGDPQESVGDDGVPPSLEDQNKFLIGQLTQAAQYVKALEERAASQKQRADDAAAAAGRLQAEFDNYRKRNAEAVKTARTEGVTDVLTQYIGKLDVFESALKMVTDQHMADGLNMLYRQMRELLENYGVREIPTDGAFDPAFHEAVGSVKSSAGGDGIAQVVKRGYFDQTTGKVLRHAAVVVFVKK